MRKPITAAFWITLIIAAAAHLLHAMGLITNIDRGYLIAILFFAVLGYLR